MSNVMNSIVKGANVVKNTVVKHSPKILVVTGIVLGVTATVTACVATTKAEKVLDEHKKKMDEIEEAKKISSPEEYTEKDIFADKCVVWRGTIFGFFKLYWLSAACTVLGTVCTLLGLHIINTRFGQVVAALATSNGILAMYRDGVVERYGEEVDREILLNSHVEKKSVEEKVVDPETGKEKTVKKDAEIINLDMDLATSFIRVFSEINPSGKKNKEWDPNVDVAVTSLKTKEYYWNQVFRHYGEEGKPITLNDVAIDCGLDWTPEGQIQGWKWEEGKYISFGIGDYSDPQVRRYINGETDALVLIFNVDPEPIICDDKKNKLED